MINYYDLIKKLINKKHDNYSIKFVLININLNKIQKYGRY